MATSPTTLKLPDELKARITALAEAQGLSVHAYMLHALKETADRADRRAEYLAAGAEGLREYERTGVAYAFEDVKDYFVALAKGDTPSRPKPIKRKTSRG